MTPTLAQHVWADKYFTRLLPWEWHDDSRIDLLDDGGAVTATLGQWPTAVFHAAEGHTTVADYFRWLLTQYPEADAIPPDLDATIATVISDLAESGAIALTDERGELDPRNDLPASETGSVDP